MSTRIGHFAINTELYLCEQENKINVPKKKYIDFFYFAAAPICNKQLALMWKRVLKILPTPIMRSIEIVNNLIPGGEIHKIGNNTKGGRDVCGLVDKTKVHLKFNEKEEKYGQDFLKKMGIGVNDKFVCLLVRDGEYLKQKKFSNRDFSYHSYRDCKIQNYKKACEYLANKGIFVIRMGENVKEKLITKNSKIIDYATNGMRNKFMDVYLGSKCFFWLSTGSGLDSLNQVFRRPIVYTNYIPMGYIIETKKDALTIFKHHFDNNEKKKLSIKEIKERNLKYAETTNNYNKENINLIENSSDEINQAIHEMYSRLTLSWEDDLESKNLQNLFWESHKSKNTIDKTIVSKIGSDFLKRNIYLFKN